jgi:hypothetical protein
MKSIILLLLLGQQQPDISLPASVQVATGDYVILKAVTKGETVVYVPLSEGLRVLDPALLKDAKSFVATGKPGSYRLLAYSAIDNRPTQPAYTTIVIGEAPKPEPGALEKGMQAVWRTIDDPEKNVSKNKILEGFSRIDQSSISTVADLNREVKDKVGSKLEPSQLRSLRDLISGHLLAVFGRSGSAAVDAAVLAKTIDEITKGLEALK